MDQKWTKHHEHLTPKRIITTYRLRPEREGLAGHGQGLAREVPGALLRHVRGRRGQRRPEADDPCGGSQDGCGREARAAGRAPGAQGADHPAPRRGERLPHRRHRARRLHGAVRRPARRTCSRTGSLRTPSGRPIASSSRSSPRPRQRGASRGRPSRATSSRRSAPGASPTGSTRRTRGRCSRPSTAWSRRPWSSQSG